MSEKRKNQQEVRKWSWRWERSYGIRQAVGHDSGSLASLARTTWFSPPCSAHHIWNEAQHTVPAWVQRVSTHHGSTGLYSVKTEFSRTSTTKEKWMLGSRNTSGSLTSDGLAAKIISLKWQIHYRWNQLKPRYFHVPLLHCFLQASHSMCPLRHPNKSLWLVCQLEGTVSDQTLSEKRT